MFPLVTKAPAPRGPNSHHATPVKGVAAAAPEALDECHKVPLPETMKEKLPSANGENCNRFD